MQNSSLDKTSSPWLPNIQNSARKTSQNLGGFLGSKRSTGQDFFATKQSGSAIGEMEDPRITMQRQRSFMTQMIMKEEPYPDQKKMASLLYKNAEPTPKQLASLRAFRKTVANKEIKEVFRKIAKKPELRDNLEIAKMRMNPGSALSGFPLEGPGPIKLPR